MAGFSTTSLSERAVAQHQIRVGVPHRGRHWRNALAGFLQWAHTTDGSTDRIAATALIAVVTVRVRYLIIRGLVEQLSAPSAVGSEFILRCRTTRPLTVSLVAHMLDATHKAVLVPVVQIGAASLPRRRPDAVN
jgi:hypothetical protein